MDLTPHLEALRRDLTSAAAPGGPEVSRAADLLAGALEPAARLALLETLSEAAAEITTRLDSACIEIRLRGRDPEIVIQELAPDPELPFPSPDSGAPSSEMADPTEAGAGATVPLAATPPDTGGDPARVTLRLPEHLKEQVEQAAVSEGISTNAWLVRVVTATLTHGRAGAPPSRPDPAAQGGDRTGSTGRPPAGRGSHTRHVTGFIQA